MTTVVLTGAGAPGAAGVIRSLRSLSDYSLEIIGVDMDEDAYGFAFTDYSAIVPHGDDPEYIDAIREVARPNADIILPITTPELRPLSEAKASFHDDGVSICISDPDPLATANNKAELYQRLHDWGHDAAPAFRRVRTADEIESIARSLGYPERPVVFKPAVSSGKRGFYVIQNDNKVEELKVDENSISLPAFMDGANDDEFQEAVLMEYLPGPEYSVDVLAYRGDIPIVVPRIRKATRKGITFVGEVTRHQQLIHTTRAICNDLELEYVLNFQFKETRGGTPKLLEINPRVPGSVILTIAAGANLPADAIRLVKGDAIHSSQDEIKWGTRMQRYWNELFYDSEGRKWQLPELRFPEDRVG